jgi:phosphate uptake regulator
MPVGGLMPDEMTEHEQLAQAVHALNDEITELGILAENAFKEAAEGLFGQEQVISESVRAAHAEAQNRYANFHTTALALLAQAPPQSDAMRRIVELQQTALEFRRIAQHAATMAEHAQALGSSVELPLMRADCPDPSVLRRIVRQAYLLVRGAVIICATRDTARARLLAREDTLLDLLSSSLREQVEVAIHAHPLQAFPLQRVVLIGAEMEAIGNRAASICNAILATR